MQVSLKYAEEHFADLISDVNHGEEVEIAQAEKPSIKLVPSTPARKSQETKRILGAAHSEIGVPTWGQWKAMDKEIEREMCDAPLIPGETLDETMQWLPAAIDKLKSKRKAESL